MSEASTSNRDRRLVGFDGLKRTDIDAMVGTLETPGQLNALTLIALSYLAVLGRVKPLQVEAIIAALGNDMVSKNDATTLTRRAFDAVFEHNCKAAVATGDLAN